MLELGLASIMQNTRCWQPRRHLHRNCNESVFRSGPIDGDEQCTRGADALKHSEVVIFGGFEPNFSSKN